VRPFALGGLMDVDRMLSRRQAVEVELDGNSVLRRGERGGSYAFPLAVLHVDGHRLSPLCFRAGGGHAPPERGANQGGPKSCAFHFSFPPMAQARMMIKPGQVLPGGHCSRKNDEPKDKRVEQAFRPAVSPSRRAASAAEVLGPFWI